MQRFFILFFIDLVPVVEIAGIGTVAMGYR